MNNQFLEILEQERFHTKPLTILGTLRVDIVNFIYGVDERNVISNTCSTLYEAVINASVSTRMVDIIGDLAMLEDIVKEWVRIEDVPPRVIIVPKEEPSGIWTIFHDYPAEHLHIDVVDSAGVPMHDYRVEHAVNETRNVTTIVFANSLRSGRAILRVSYSG